MNKRFKRVVKDTVFTAMFEHPRFIKQLCDALLPEKNIQEEEIEILTLHNVFCHGIHNDLGFCAQDKIIVLCEAQSTWSENILIRMLLYLAETIRNYVDQRNINLYTSTLAEFPQIHLYVIYTGSRTSVPDSLNFETCFPSGSLKLNFTIHVISKSTGDDLVSQYNEFSRIQTEQNRLHSDSPETAARNILDECKKRRLLSEFIEMRGEDFMDITTLLFDQDTVTRIAVNDAHRKGKAEGKAEGIEEGVEIGFEKGEKNKVKTIILDSCAQHIDPDLTCQLLRISREEYDRVILESFSQDRHSES